MARTSVIRDETIIAAARKVFLSRGIRATTADVAEQAGISEGSIFKRFKSKVELFQAAMGSHVDEPPFLRNLAGTAGCGNLKDNLVSLAQDLTGFFQIVTPLMMMSWSNPSPEGAPCLLSQKDAPPRKMMAAVTAYLQEEIARGRLAARNPEIVARAFIGAVHNYVVLQVIFRSETDGAIDSTQFVRELIETLWGGIAPRSTEKEIGS